MRPSNVRTLALAGIAIAALLGAGIGYAFAPRNASGSFNGGEPLAQSDGYRSLNITRDAYSVFVPRFSSDAYDVHAEWSQQADVLIVAPTYADIRAAITDGAPPHLHFQIEDARSLDTSVTPYRPLNGIMPAEHAAPILARMYASQLGNASGGRLPDEALIAQYDQFLLAAYSFVIIFRTDEPPAEMPGRMIFASSVTVKTGGPNLIVTWALLTTAGLLAAGALGSWLHGKRADPRDAATSGSVLERALRSSAQFEAFARRTKTSTRALTAAVALLGFAGFVGVMTFQRADAHWAGRDSAISAFLSLFTFFAGAAVTLGILAIQRTKEFERDMRDWRIRFEEVREDQERFLEGE